MMEYKLWKKFAEDEEDASSAPILAFLYQEYVKEQEELKRTMGILMYNEGR